MRYFLLIISILICLPISAQEPKLGKINKLIDKEMYEKAMIAVDEQLLKVPHASLYHLRGYCLSQLGQQSKALNDFNESIRRNPNHAQAFLDRGFTYFSLGESDKAIADFTSAIRLDLNFGEAYLNRGTVRFEKGDISGACDDWHMALQLGIPLVRAIIEENCAQ